MPTWKEQIKAIKILRLQRIENDKKLYSTQIGLQKVENELHKITSKKTVIASDLAAIKDLRQRIRELDKSNQELNIEIARITNVLGSMKDNTELIRFLDKKVLLLTSEIAIIKEQILESQSPLTSRQTDKELQNRLEKSNNLLTSLTQDLAATKREQVPLVRQGQAARRKKEELDKKRENTKKDIAELQEFLKDKLISGGQSTDEVERSRNELKQRFEQNKIDLEASKLALHDAITGIYSDPHPRTAVTNLDDKIPFLLIPVRIETRFVTTDSNPELWLRIYPDDIVIHTHEKLLTKTELSEGEKYWIALFNANKNGGPEKEDQKKQAWTNIAGLFGAQRSAWIATQTKPTNWNGLNNMSDSSQLIFPINDITKTSAWSMAPRAYELPDKFVVMLYVGNTVVKEVSGNIIPDELIVGPDPMNPDESFVKVDDILGFGQSFDWTSNFEKAVKVGMGFRIELTATQASRGFDKILVLGLNLSADEMDGKKNLEALIDNHHYSSKGLSLVRQGTPTNNTEQDEAGYTSNDPFNNISYFVETGKPLFAATTDCDGKNLADALGINYGSLQHIQNSNARDLREAKAMNTALYSSTLGYYFNTLLKPVLGEPIQNKLRDFFIDHVTGRGGLPAIRVGNQPYGILLTSDFSNWQWARSESPEDSQFLGGLQKVLRHYSNIWRSFLNELMYTGKPGVDPSEGLMNILGLQAGSVAYHQRIGYSTDDLKNRAGFQQWERYAEDLQNSFNNEGEVLAFFVGLGYSITDENGKLQVPQLLRIIYQHFHMPLNAADVVDDSPLSEIDPIRSYNGTANNYIHWLLGANSTPILERQDFGEGGKTPKSLLYLQLRRSFLLQLNDSTHKWLNNRGITFKQTLEPVNFHNIKKSDLTKWEVMKGKVGIAEPEHPQKNKSIADHLLTTGSNEAELAFMNEMKKSLKLLADLPTARLERCFTEHLDTCTYRLDAWQTAFFHRRLQNQRNTSRIIEEGQERVMGIFLGSFGWVEDIRPSNKRKVVERSEVPGELATTISPLYEYADNGGFVHTPSLTHAMAAAVLRSGYMNHASVEEPDIMAVNLSSQRVRRAMSILMGINNGQSLEALLGYQFERGLHDRGSQSDELKDLNTYIYNFRNKFPLNQHLVQQQGANSTTETIPANHVINGLTLAENTEDFPYGATGSVTSANEAQKKAVIEEKDKLADTLDAINDLLLSESVYQLVQGNVERCAAVMNAMKDSNNPPELEIINTPRSSRFTFTNRVSIHFQKIDPDPFATPRARMEGGMNRWLESILGNMSDLGFRVSHTDSEGGEFAEDLTVSDLGIQPIDLIYLTGNELNTGESQPEGENRTAASELETRIAYFYRNSNALADETQVHIEFMAMEKPEGKKPLGGLLLMLKLLKSMITDSRSLNAEDFDPLSKANMAGNNPGGYDAEDLYQRTNDAKAIFQEYYDKLNETDVFLNEPVAGVNGEIQLGTLFAALERSDQSLMEVVFTLQNLDAVKLSNTLVLISNFGLSDSFPQVSLSLDEDKKAVLLEQVKNVAKRMATIIQKSTDLINDANLTTDIGRKVGKFVQVGKLMFGDVFNILPLFEYSNASDIQQSADDRVQLLKYGNDQLKMDYVADEWLQNISHVRPRMARWDSIRTLYELFNDGSLDLNPIQLPYRANDSWLAVEFPAESTPGKPFNIEHDTCSIIIHGDTAFEVAGKQSGIMVDEIVEMIPGKDEITGLTFNYNQPNSVPPQALLLAVAPKLKGNWNWDELVGILNDTLLRAKLRAVEPAFLDKSTKSEIGVLLPAILANFSKNDLDFALDYRSNLPFFAENAPVNPVIY